MQQHGTPQCLPIISFPEEPGASISSRWLQIKSRTSKRKAKNATDSSDFTDLENILIREIRGTGGAFLLSSHSKLVQLCATTLEWRPVQLLPVRLAIGNVSSAELRCRLHSSSLIAEAFAGA